ncbi:MAG: porin [Methylococcaceae bacterium]|jgi:hypothetical protein|nr:porin [Methylococcaceae bacterium]
MKQPKRLLIHPILVGILTSLNAIPAMSDDLEESTGLFNYLGADPNDLNFMKDSGVQIGGWLDVGISGNTNNSPGGFNGPVTFGDRDGYVQMNQLYFYLQRAVDTAGDGWDIGGRFDFMYGSDAVFTQAYGAPQGNWDLNLMPNDASRFYKMALPQAYVEVFAPVGNGLSTKIGHFYTIIGNEVVTAPDNFFYSHAYTMQYGEPFTHTGVLSSYPIDDNWTLNGGVVTGSVFGGWDGGFNQGLGNWNGLGGVNWASDDKGTSAALSFTTGPISEQNSSNLSMYSLVIKHDIIEGLHYTFQNDWGQAENLVTNLNGQQQNASWYGLNNYVVYDIMENLGIGLRGEWFRDQNGTRVFSPGRTLSLIDPVVDPITQEFTGLSKPASYYAFTLGLNWKPLKWAMVRPSIRYDWSDNANAFNNGTSAVDWKGNRQDQLLLSTDFVITF